MRVRLDRTACQGHGRCYALAPELFDGDEEGFSVLLVDGDLPEHLVDDARTAADNCPEFAIEVE